MSEDTKAIEEMQKKKPRSWEIYAMMALCIPPILLFGGPAQFVNPLLIAPVIGIFLRKKWLLYYGVIIYTLSGIASTIQVHPNDKIEFAVINIICIVGIIVLSRRGSVREGL